MMALPFELILETSAVITTILQFLTGVIVCHKYIQKKSTGESSGFPFVCGFLSCSLWLRYGFLRGENIVIMVNIVGSTLMFFYTVIYYVFTVNKKHHVRQFAIALLFLITIIIYTKYEEPSKGVEMMGYICCFITVMFFGAPLTMLLHVIRVKNSESLPFPLITASFVVSLQWFIYGITIDDYFIQIPNLLGCILSAAQLSLFICYPPKSFSGPAYKLVDQNPIVL